MRTHLDCIPCLVRQTLDSVRFATDDEQIHEQVVREVLRLASGMDMSQSIPSIAQKIHRLLRILIGRNDPYRKVKNWSNTLALKLYPNLKKLIETSSEPLEAAVRMAIAGNIIDFGVKHSLEESDIEKAIDDCLISDFDKTQFESFREAVSKAENILYLADNAGEIVFDRLLIEQLGPEKVTLAVKARPVLNDATSEDARAAGLISLVAVIDNGDDAPGTILETCSVAFQHYFGAADVVIAKGQGNYESLSDVDKNIFFLLKAKCSVIAEHLGCKLNQMILQRSDAFTGADNSVKGGKVDAWV